MSRRPVTKLLNEIALRDVVLDHECVERAHGGSACEIVAVHAGQADRIAHVDFVKQDC